MTSIMPTHESFFTPNSLKYHHHIVPQNGWVEGGLNKENGHHMCLGVGRIEEVAKLFLLSVIFLERNVPLFKSFCYKNHKMV